MSKNPLELVYEKIWTLLEDNSAFTYLVPAGNRIKYYGGDAQPDKPEVSTADLPEVRVIPVGDIGNPYSDSAMSSIRIQFAIQVASGRQEITWLLQLKWAIWCAMHNWDTALKLEDMQWNGATFVTSCRPFENKDSIHNQELNRGIKGWSSVWQGEIDCQFLTSTLRAWEGT